jgi:predicted Zn-dependent protease
MHTVNKQELKMSAQMLKRFQSQVDSVQRQLDVFRADFDKDPAHALSWGTDTFRAAAKLTVLRQVVTALEAGTANKANILQTLTDRILHRAKYPPQSSSPTGNLIEQYELAACADIVSDLEYMD